MKTTTLIALAFFLLLGNNFCAAQQAKHEKKETPPHYIYLFPDLKKAQVDSLINAIKKYDITLNFETLEYDSTNSIIKKVKGTVSNRYMSKGTFESYDFKGLTIITTKEQCGVVVGIVTNTNEEK